MLLFQSNEIFLKALPVADQFADASPALVAVPAEITKGKPVSETSFVSPVLFVCFEKVPNQVTIQWQFLGL